jgi:putative membrane protein
MKWMLIPAIAVVAACSGGENANRNTAQSGTMPGDTSMAAAPADTAHAAAPAPALDDAAIVTQLAQADMAEVQQARTALKESKNAVVRSLAQRLETDHAAHLKQMRDLAAKLKVPAPDSSAVPPAPELQGKTGAAFDSAFVQHAVDDHKQDIDKLQNTMLPAAQSADLKALIQKTVPKLQAHLALAQAAERKLGR